MAKFISYSSGYTKSKGLNPYTSQSSYANYLTGQQGEAEDLEFRKLETAWGNGEISDEEYLNAIQKRINSPLSASKDLTLRDKLHDVQDRITENRIATAVSYGGINDVQEAIKYYQDKLGKLTPDNLRYEDTVQKIKSLQRNERNKQRQMEFTDIVMRGGGNEEKLGVLERLYQDAVNDGDINQANAIYAQYANLASSVQNAGGYGGGTSSDFTEVNRKYKEDTDTLNRLIAEKRYTEANNLVIDMYNEQEASYNEGNNTAGNNMDTLESKYLGYIKRDENGNIIYKINEFGQEVTDTIRTDASDAFKDNVDPNSYIDENGNLIGSKYNPNKAEVFNPEFNRYDLVKIKSIKNGVPTFDDPNIVVDRYGNIVKAKMPEGYTYKEGDGTYDNSGKKVSDKKVLVTSQLNERGERIYDSEGNIAPDIRTTTNESGKALQWLQGTPEETSKASEIAQRMVVPEETKLKTPFKTDLASSVGVGEQIEVPWWQQIADAFKGFYGYKFGEKLKVEPDYTKSGLEQGVPGGGGGGGASSAYIGAMPGKTSFGNQPVKIASGYSDIWNPSSSRNIIDQRNKAIADQQAAAAKAADDAAARAQALLKQNVLPSNLASRLTSQTPGAFGVMPQLPKPRVAPVGPVKTTWDTLTKKTTTKTPSSTIGRIGAW